MLGAIAAALAASARSVLFGLPIYAHNCNGRPMATFTHTAESLRCADELQPAEREVAEILRVSAGYFLGTVSRTSLDEARDRVIRRAPTEVAVPLEVARLRGVAADDDSEQAREKLARQAGELETRAASVLGVNHAVTHDLEPSRPRDPVSGHAIELVRGPLATL